MPRSGHSKEQKIKIIEHVINERYKAPIPMKQLCEGVGISTVTLYNWLKTKEFVDLKEKLNEAVNYTELHDTTVIKLAAKKGLEFLVKKSKVNKVTYSYDYYPILDEDGEIMKDKDGKDLLKEVLKSKRIEKIDVPPDAKVVMFAMGKLFPQFDDVNKMESMMENFMEFNDFVKNLDPQLAKRFVIYQNNYLAKKVKEIEYEDVKENE